MNILPFTSKSTTFKSHNKLHPIDLAYKKALQQGLKDTFQLDCKIKDLTSIAGPVELKHLINNLKPNNYEVGENFRANFHLHTIASDGNLTPKEFLEQCLEWANHIFKTKPKDNLPPFSAAITDHDRVKSVKEALAIIAQTPDKYKNFRFVTGCEFLFHGYKEPHTCFEAIGLGFNPFDKKLTPLMKGFESNNQIEDVQKVIKAGGILSWAHPLISPDKITNDFFTFLKSIGINGIEGNYQYSKFDEEYINEGKKFLKPFIEKFKPFLTGGTDSHSKSIF